MSIRIHFLDVHPEQVRMAHQILRKCPYPEELDEVVTREGDRYYINSSIIHCYSTHRFMNRNAEFFDQLNLLDKELVSLVLKLNRLTIEESKRNERVRRVKKCLKFFDIPLSVYEVYYKV